VNTNPPHDLATASGNGNGPLFSKGKPLAARIGIHQKTLARWANAGLIHRHRINSRIILYKIEEVLAFVGEAKV